MKLRIVHQNQENRAGEEQTVKKETMEIVRTEEEPETRVLSEEDENSPIAAAASQPMILSGKRKRKPKELIDEVSPIRWWKKKKTNKSSASKSKPGMPESGGTLASNKDATVGCSSTPVKSPTVIRAEEIQAGLGSDRPNFLKVLVRSHVGSCFWMGLPVPFCKIHLPDKDTAVVLENEDGEEFPIKYIAHKTGLSAGWRKFVAGNKLLVGDVLIFQLTGPCRLKVYIVRANDLTEVDGALSLLILDSQTKQSDADGTMDAQAKKKRRPKSLLLTVVQNKNQNKGPPTPAQPEEHSGNDSGEVASEVLESCKFSESTPRFKDIDTFEQFHIVINGVCLDSEFPENTRRKYYDLCCSKNSFLHERLLPGLYSKLAVGVIIEIVNIADFLRNCKLTTPRKEFEVWEKSLRSFELLGLNVGFLKTRLKQLLSLAFDSEGAEDARRYLDAKTAQREVEDQIQLLEAKLTELKELYEKYDREIEESKTKTERYELNFQEEANAPW